jgi:hypothetical protein
MEIAKSIIFFIVICVGTYIALTQYQKTIKGLKGNIKDIQDKYEQNKVTLVKCETCGCLMRMEDSFAGKSEIRENPSWSITLGRTISDPYIYVPRYCKVHIPISTIGTIVGSKITDFTIGAMDIDSSKIKEACKCKKDSKKK